MSVIVSAFGNVVNAYRDNNNLPLVGGMLLTQAGGVNFPTYTEPSGTIQNTNPIILNSRGEIATSSGTSIPLYLQQNIAYTFTLFDSSGNQIWSTVPITAPTTIAYPSTTAETAASITPTSTAYPFGNVSRYGAVGNGLTDDSAALNTAVKLGQQGYYDIQMEPNGAGAGYDIASTVTTSYAGQGQVNFKGATIHGPAVLYPTMGTYVFEFDADPYGQQEVKYKIENFMVQGDGTHNPSFMRTSWIYFSECNSVNSFSSGPVIDWQYGGNNVSRGCTAFGGTIGFNNAHCHDSYVTEFHAYGCQIGCQAIGTNNNGQDGNVNFVNGASHGNSQYGFYIKGLYTPTLINVVAEVQPVNIHLENCQYGLTWGAFLGPASGGLNYSIHYKWASGAGNTWNIVGAVNAQNEMQLEQMQSSIIADSIIGVATNSITGAAISFNAGALNILSGLLIRNPLLAYSYIQDITSNNQIINGGRYEQTIYLQGTKAQRSGNVIMPNYLYGGLKTDDAVQGQLALSEYVRFWDGTRINESSFGYLLPYLAQTGTLTAGGTATFDTGTLMPAVMGAINSAEAEFMVSGGLAGSISASKVLSVRGFQTTTATILGGNGALGSFTVSVSGSVITVSNPSGTSGAPYAIRMTKLAAY